MDIRRELQQAVNEYLDRGVMSQANLARVLGVSDATVINVKRGEWKNVSNGMMAKFRAYFKLDGWHIRNTHNFQVITKLCEDARQAHRFMAVAGYTGAGKTTALRKYAQDNPETYYVLATILHTRRTFLEAVQRSMGISSGSSTSDMMAAIIEKVNSAENPLLIVDDAGKLKHSCLTLLQIIYDHTEHTAGMVIAGTEYLKEEIDKQSRRNTLGFRELRRRIAYWQPLHRPTKKVIAGICADFSITDGNAIDYIHKNALDYGTIRNLILNAATIAKRNDIAVTRELLVGLHVGDMAYENQKVA